VHRFRFAIQADGAASARQWRELARRMEGEGYSTLFVPDHFGEQWGPLVALTVAAEATSTLRVGSLVFDNDYRHPVVLAKELATLDLVSEGRLEVGMGAGWMRSDYEQAGIAYDRPGVRIERMAEALSAMKSLWSDTQTTLRGDHYTITDASGHPRPHDGCPPVIIGGGSPRVLALAAAEADIVGINPSLAAGYVGPEVAASATLERFQERVEWVRQAAGPRFDQLELQCLTFIVQVVPNRREVIESFAPAFGMSPEVAEQVPIALVGTVEELVDILERRREELGLSYWVVHEGDLEAFAPVVDRLAGR
jgi:probable F420-dependent oxidoreductase